MRRGACVIRRQGKRGVVFYVKYVDAAGTQVKERVGSEADGWTEQKARAELEARLTDVRREGLRKPSALSFAAFADDWLATYADARGLKRSTRESYRSLLDCHLKPAFGPFRLDQLDVAAVERYLAAKRRAAYEPRTLNRHLNLLGLVLRYAVRRGLVRANPVAAVERPREPRRRWTILNPVEIGRVERALVGLAEEADADSSAWVEQARVVFLT